MPVVSRIVSVVLRVAEIFFGAVVTGIIGHYLNNLGKFDVWFEARWIYTIVVAALSMLLALLWLIPCSFGFKLFPIDIILSLAWFAAFGILVDAVHKFNCGSIWVWNNFLSGEMCGRWKAAEAFAFLSAFVWLVSGIVGIWFTFRKDSTGGRRRWRSAV